MVILNFKVGPLLRTTGKEIAADHVSTLAAQTAYYFFFSLFPLLLFLAPILSLVVEPEALRQTIMSRVASALPTEAASAVDLVLRNIVFAKNAPGLMSLGAVLAAWSGSNIFGALMTALNTAYDVEETRPWWKRTGLRLLMLVIGGVTMVVATVVLLGGEDVARSTGKVLGLGEGAIHLWNLLQFPLAVAVIALLAFLTYWLLPNVRQRKQHILVAALVATLLWLLATLLFRLYVQRFPPNPTYGLIGGVMILLTWMYYTMFVLLACGELASELHHGSGAVEPPRGATYYGRIVSGEHPRRPSVSEG